MLISVVIPTFNRQTLILRALESVFEQSRPADEVIVVDDGSTDGTMEEVTKKFPQAKYIPIAHQGVSAARNVGIKAARGRWVAFLDSDDVWHSDKLMRQIAFIEANPNARLIHCDENWVRDGKHLNQKSYHEKTGGDLFERSLQRCLISPSAVVINAVVFDRIGMFDETLTACEDYDLWLRICAQERVEFIPEKLITKYGGHPDQLSKTVWGLDRFRIQSLRKIISSKVLTDTQRALAILTVQKKLKVYINGAQKRGRLNEVSEYTQMLNEFTS